MEAGVNDPAVHFQDKIIRVKGTVIIKEQRPRIEVDDPKDIQIVKNPVAKDAKPKPKAKVPPPTFENVKYGPHERNVLDFWQAKSEQPTPVQVSIHGGGFVCGNKSVSPQLLKECLDSGISVAAINYRYSTQAIAPAPFHDGAKAIQFLRSKAKDWNIDSKRFAVMGGSAGAGISLWLGFHEDMADPKNDDPVLRQSTRLNCMAVFEGQTSYDPRAIRKMFPDKDIYKIGALQKLFDFDPNKLDDLPAEKYRLFEEVSPINHVTKNAPPVLLWYNNPIDAEITNQGIGIHHPLFGKMLKDKMDSLKIPCEVNAAGKRIGGGTPTRTIDFLREHLALKMKAEPNGGKAVNGLVASAEVVEQKPAKDPPYLEVRFTLKNVSDKPITICDYVGNQPLKVEWIGPDGKALKSDHYGWPSLADIAPLTEKNFVTIPAGGTRRIGPRGENSGIIFQPMPEKPLRFGNVTKPGEHRVTVSYVNNEDGKKFNQQNVWIGTVTANELTFTVK